MLAADGCGGCGGGDQRVALVIGVSVALFGQLSISEAYKGIGVDD